jgi:hypothetical protein
VLISTYVIARLWNPVGPTGFSTGITRRVV